MPDEIHSANITIAGVEDTGTQIKIRDQNKKTYSFFKQKKDGSETAAYRDYNQFKVGDTVMVVFKEVPYKDGTIKNVMNFKPATGEPDQQPMVSTRHYMEQKGIKPGRKYWEQREAKRQSSILMQVAFKSAVAMEAARVRAGQEESRDRIYDTAMEFYDWMDNQIGEETAKSEIKERQKVEAGSDDDIIF